MEDSGACEESVYKSGDQLHITLSYWGLRVVTLNLLQDDAAGYDG